MTEFFEAFNPGARFLRQQRDLEKSLVVEQKKGGTGPQPLDLESGRITLVIPDRTAREPAPRRRGTPAPEQRPGPAADGDVDS